MQGKCVDADQSQKELGDGNPHHTHNAQYLIQGSSFLRAHTTPRRIPNMEDITREVRVSSMVAGRWFFIRVSTGTPL